MPKEISIDCNSFEHGGDIYRVAAELKIQERKVIDFSSSVNPLGVSGKVKAEIRRNLKYLHNYPDPESTIMRKRLAHYHGLAPETIICGNGSTELIYLITRSLRPKKVLVTAPTYSEYERAVLLQNITPSITYFMLNKENCFEINPDEFIATLRTPNSELHFDIAFLCNPNNPTGRLLKKGDVKRIADEAAALKCCLVVDEAFIDYSPDNSVIQSVSRNPYLIVLRTMSNFYALSGLRVGYGVFPQHLVERLKEFKEPWSVNRLAQKAALTAIKDRAYKKETYRLLDEEKRFLERNFRKLKIAFFPSDANFFLLKIENAAEICRHLLKKGILLRNCFNFKGLGENYMRVSIKSHRENAILVKELASLIVK
ncbi:MAG: threonine-phosphate decarboxylase CobD [Nitrospirota bacterium]